MYIETMDLKKIEMFFLKSATNSASNQKQPIVYNVVVQKYRYRYSVLQSLP
jgi:hypothetical protein